MASTFVGIYVGLSPLVLTVLQVFKGGNVFMRNIRPKFVIAEASLAMVFAFRSTYALFSHQVISIFAHCSFMENFRAGLRAKRWFKW